MPDQTGSSQQEEMEALNETNFEFLERTESKQLEHPQSLLSPTVLFEKSSAPKTSDGFLHFHVLT